MIVRVNVTVNGSGHVDANVNAKLDVKEHLNMEIFFFKMCLMFQCFCC